MAEKIPEFLRTSSINVNQTYSYINNTGFYALANPIYYDFYFRFIRRYAWWYDRFVPDVHKSDQGIFSTGIAHALVDGIANKIVGRKLLFEAEGGTRKIRANTLAKAYEWGKATNFTEKIRNATKYGGALGTSLLKLNVSNKGLWLEALRFDNFFFETDFKGDLQNVTCLINSYTDTNSKSYSWKDTDGECPQMRLDNKYYLVERRYFEEKAENVNGELIKHKVPYVVYEVKKYRGNIINTQVWDLNLQETYNYKSIPKNVLNSIARDYGAVRIGEPRRLPFYEYLGCELFKYNDGDGSLPQQPFGESILTNILAFLQSYDTEYSWFMRDLYQGKGIIFMAKELRTVTSGQDAFSGLDDSMITKVSLMNDQGKLPIEKSQFDLRVAEWREARNLIYENIATHLNISPSSIANFLSDNTARTAKEVTTEEKDTDNYIDIQRGCLSPCVDRILDCVAKFYGWGCKIKLKFSQSGMQNLDSIIDRMIKLKSAGLVHPKDALRQIMQHENDASEEDVERAWKELDAYNKTVEQQKADSLFNLDYGTSIGGLNGANS